MVKTKKYHLEHGEPEHGPKSMTRAIDPLSSTPDLKRSQTPRRISVISTLRLKTQR